MDQKSEFLQIALEATKKAEAIIMQYYSTELDTEKKKDKTIVTVADKEAEKNNY